MKSSLTIVGLGPGRAGLLSWETFTTLNEAAGKGQKLLLRTARHPSVALLQEKKIPFQSFDFFYESYENFESLYEAICQDCLRRLAQGEHLIYAVPGSPFVAEKTVELLTVKAREKGYLVNILPGMSFLEVLYTRLGLDPNQGLLILDAQSLIESPRPLYTTAVITQVYSQLLASDLKLALMDFLADDTEVTLIYHLSLPDEEVLTLPLYELDRVNQIDHLTSLVIPYNSKQIPAIKVEPLVQVMADLRSPQGCPWDREQTHPSLRRYLIEEVYEVIEAIDLKSPELLREELGDLLLQIVFHARIAEEQGLFNMQDVVQEVTEKMIRRHPHVFGSVQADTADQVVANWEAIKAREKSSERKRVLDGIAPGLPALMRAQKLQTKAAKVGFDWDNLLPIWDKLFEEIQELQEALAQHSEAEVESELGDCIFVLVNLARFLKLDAEMALNGTNRKFFSRFNYVEDCVNQSGRPWSSFTVEDLDKFWEKAKKHEIPAFSQKE